MSDRAYFFAENGEPRGPFSLAELMTRSIAPTTLVWREGLAEWSRADSMSELTTLFTPAVSQPTVVPVAVNPVLSTAMPFPPTATADAPGLQPIGYRTAVLEDQPAGGIAIASLVLGIISILSICGFHVGPILGLPCSILAVVFGHIALKKARSGEAGGRGLAKAGLVLGYVYLGLCAVIIAIILVVAVIFMMK